MKLLQPITVCVALKDRSKGFIENVVGSMNRCEHSELLSISLYDWNTEDVPDLEELTRQHWKGELIFQRSDYEMTEGVYFNKPYAINEAVKKAPSDLVFLCDSDMVLPPNFLELMNEYVAPSECWFPICYSLHRGKPCINNGSGSSKSGYNGKWRHTGRGMMGFVKEDYLSIGGYDPHFVNWGGGDNNLFNKALEAGYKMTREKCDGLYHVWHEKTSPYHKKRNKGWSSEIKRTKANERGFFRDD